jgi:hypothetical protein
MGNQAPGTEQRPKTPSPQGSQGTNSPGSQGSQDRNRTGQMEQSGSQKQPGSQRQDKPHDSNSGASRDTTGDSGGSGSSRPDR